MGNRSRVGISSDAQQHIRILLYHLIRNRFIHRFHIFHHLWTGQQVEEESHDCRCNGYGRHSRHTRTTGFCKILNHLPHGVHRIIAVCGIFCRRLLHYPLQLQGQTRGFVDIRDELTERIDIRTAIDGTAVENLWSHIVFHTII